jgi:hypothetical protein
MNRPRINCHFWYGDEYPNVVDLSSMNGSGCQALLGDSLGRQSMFIDIHELMQSGWALRLSCEALLLTLCPQFFHSNLPVMSMEIKVFYSFVFIFKRSVLIIQGISATRF